MPRPIRKEINFTKESILALMQEIYNELVEQRNTAIRIQNKMLSMMKEPEDMMTLGPVIEKQQKIVNDCVEKKINLSKIQSTIWEKSNNSNESFTLSDCTANSVPYFFKFVFFFFAQTSSDRDEHFIEQYLKNPLPKLSNPVSFPHLKQYPVFSSPIYFL